MAKPGQAYDVTIDEDGVRFHGIDWGTGVKPLEIHHQHGDILVLKIPGHNSWRDQLHPSVYEPAAFLVVRLLNSLPVDSVEFITIFPIRKGVGVWAS